MINIYKGNIVFTPSKDCFEIIENGYLCVKDGIIVEVSSEIPEKFTDYTLTDFGDKLIIPGFTDLHLHAPQFPNRGLGLDEQLLVWLEKYTFPEEKKYSDLEYAEKVFTKVAELLLRFGTTRAVIFNTIHIESTDLLMSILDKFKLPSYVGKVNMDRNSPDFLQEITEKSLQDTKKWIENTISKYNYVKPIITPRFSPTCSKDLMNGLSEFAKIYKLPIQTHISENKEEVSLVKELHPENKSYADVYDSCNLLGERTILAHCVYNTDDELDLMKKRGIFAAHCPNANYNLASGIMPLRKMLDMDINIGLGSDVGAGHEISIAKVMRATIQASKIAWIESGKEFSPISLSEAFYLGTKSGGSFFGNVGSFEVGYEFDALVIDDSNLNIGYEKDLHERIERFIYIGDDRNIVKRFIKGNEIFI